MNLLQKQVTTLESLKALCSNYKKDSVSRKTIDYLERRLESLEKLWVEFHERDEAISQSIQDRTGIDYYTNKIYENAKHMYESTKMNMMEMIVQHQQQKQQNVEFDLTGILREETDDNLKELLTTQECYFKALERVMSKIDVKYEVDKWELEDHLSTLKIKWQDVDRQHWRLEAVLKGSYLRDEYITKFEAIENKYDNLKKTLNNKLNSNIHYQRSAPQIEIPLFSGNYTQWLSFKDTFTDVIHNNPTISTCQKMQYLKTKLRGEAERLVQHLSISADNYYSCWDILTQRYDHRRMQFNAYMKMMYEFPTIQGPNLYNLKKLHETINECLNGLTNMGVETTNWDPMVAYFMSQKLDNATYDEYIKEMKNKRDVPDLQEFLAFLEDKFMSLEASRKPSKSSSSFQEPTTTHRNIPRFGNKNNNNNYNSRYNERRNYEKAPLFERNRNYSRTFHTVSFTKCPQCSGDHVLMQCDAFLSMDTKQRNYTVAKLNVCKNCLYRHESGQCTSPKSCKECNYKHHTLLHYYMNEPNTNFMTNRKQAYYNSEPSTSKPQNSHYVSTDDIEDIQNQVSSSQKSTSKTQNSHYTSADDVEILLTTVQVRVQAQDGTFIKLRALLDQGSQVNLITENAAQRLHLERNKLNAVVSGIGSAAKDCRGLVKLTGKSIHSDYTFSTEALILKQITNKLPNQTIRNVNWSHIDNLKLADPEYNVSNSVDILLGADIYAQILMQGVLKGDTNSPTAQQTCLGWILCGKLKTFNCHAAILDISDLSKYWENEDILSSPADISSDDQCEAYYQQTTSRNTDGTYVVRLPMLEKFEDELGDSLSTAISQYLQLEKRLEKNQNWSAMYRSFIQEYCELKHMKHLSHVTNYPMNNNVTQFYLPHHGVLREDSTTTKLRVVYNASQKSTSGKSLNNLMEKGPNLQKDIQELILKWRTYKYAFTADIEKMYRCIWIAEDQQCLQKIIWRNSTTDRLSEYALCTVTYGTKCAPWLAMRTLRQLAIDDGVKFPLAANALQNEFYVDDLISGNHSLESAQQLQNELIELLRGGGMNLRKWSSNCQSLLTNLNEDQISKATYDFKHEEPMKTLGLGWNPNLDTFTFNWNIQEKTNKQLTKRTLLSQISQLYDPLGWFSPVTITAKLIFQQVWTKNLEWDEELPKHLQESWLKLKNELSTLKNIKINRWIGSTHNNIELFGFCDASERAFSCVIYTRVIDDETKQPMLTLLIAKTRVAPLSQKLSLPRLELCGALLLSQLIQKTKNALKDYNITTRAWCDSKVVLAWLQTTETKWERYVQDRVVKIRQIIPASQWKYIDSKNNPADCATRGLYPNKLRDFELWWEGPPLLKQFSETIKETRKCLFTTNIDKKLEGTTLEGIDNNLLYELIYKHSSLTRAIRVLAWILRFVAKTRLNTKTIEKCDMTIPNYLTMNELNESNTMFIKYVQRYYFKTEYNLLLRNETLTKKSTLYKLNVYLDKEGIMRVGGRLNKTNLPLDMKNPIILPKNGRFTELLIDRAHITTMHGGARLTLAHLRQRYWIVGGNRAVKTQLRRCVRCHRFKSNENYQLMADLPAQRVTPSRPFTHSGIDYTGHVYVKLNKGRGVRLSKGYIAIFVCMATKAVHIELVSDLSTESFMGAFKRMCARRGTPKHIYSDCGTNFIGASKVLRNEYELFKQELSADFFDELNQMEVQWHFNAPLWPSAGGLWEAAVRSMKHHLRRVLGDQKLTYEEFTTLLTQIEACMNSRPLCPLTEDPEEFANYLTPGHFLTGSATLTLPLSNYEDDQTIDLRKRWQLTEHMFHRFWKLWSQDYLTQLQARSKWQKPTHNLQINDIVLVKESNLPPGKWAMGRVIKVHPGSDGHVRVATIKTQTGTIKRPIVKLSPLPIEHANEKLEQPEEESKGRQQFQGGASPALLTSVPQTTNNNNLP